METNASRGQYDLLVSSCYLHSTIGYCSCLPLQIKTQKKIKTKTKNIHINIDAHKMTYKHILKDIHHIYMWWTDISPCEGLVFIPLKRKMKSMIWISLCLLFSVMSVLIKQTSYNKRHSSFENFDYISGKIYMSVLLMHYFWTTVHLAAACSRASDYVEQARVTCFFEKRAGWDMLIITTKNSR